MKLFFKKNENQQSNSLVNKKEIKEEKAIQKRQNKRKKRSIKELAFKSAEFREAEFLLKKNKLSR